jgi:hypothetical protein
MAVSDFLGFFLFFSFSSSDAALSASRVRGARLRPDDVDADAGEEGALASSFRFFLPLRKTIAGGDIDAFMASESFLFVIPSL